ncbi:MAG: alpha/beta hydrolase [Acidimicrobiales bacterium]
MPLDHDVARLLDALNQLDTPALSEGTVAEARANYFAAPKPEGDVLARVSDHRVPGPAGEVPVRVYAPSTEPGLPVVAFFHGGGWVLSSVDGHDSLARRLAASSGALVVSVDYRLAPEHPFPAPHDDCWAVTRWLADHAEELGGDPGRLAVAGDSAGGNLAAGVALRARDEGLPLRFQLLIYPCIDVEQTRPSMRDNADGYFLTAADMAWFWDQFVPPGHRDDPYAVPMRAGDVAGLAPALIQTAEFDPLRDEGEAWGARLADAGVPVTVTRYDGVVHGFVSRWIQMARAADAHREAADRLRAAFGLPTAG